MSKRASALAAAACCVLAVLPVLRYVARQAAAPPPPPKSADMVRLDMFARFALASDLRTVPGVVAVDAGTPGALAVDVHVSATNRAALVADAWRVRDRLARKERRGAWHGTSVPLMRIVSPAGVLVILPTLRLVEDGHYLSR